EAIKGLMKLHYSKLAPQRDLATGRYVTRSVAANFYHPINYTPPIVASPSHKSTSTSKVYPPVQAKERHYAHWAFLKDSSEEKNEDEVDELESNDCEFGQRDDHEKTLTRQFHQRRSSSSAKKQRTKRAIQISKFALDSSQKDTWAKLQRLDLGFKTRGDKRRAAIAGML
ncbi:hypothetical protein P7C70_g9450, partial [Phenoliferia sp. Uapishka_3]